MVSCLRRTALPSPTHACWRYRLISAVSAPIPSPGELSNLLWVSEPERSEESTALVETRTSDAGAFDIPLAAGLTQPPIAIVGAAGYAPRVVVLGEDPATIEMTAGLEARVHVRDHTAGKQWPTPR